MLKKLSLAPVILLLSSISLAGPSTLYVSFRCPNPALTQDAVENLGVILGGYGLKVMDINQSTIYDPIFYSSDPVTSPTYPDNLISYHNNGTDYSSLKSHIECKYVSAKAAPPFSLFYQLTNGSSARVMESTQDYITLALPVAAH